MKKNSLEATPSKKIKMRKDVNLQVVKKYRKREDSLKKVRQDQQINRSSNYIPLQ